MPTSLGTITCAHFAPSALAVRSLTSHRRFELACGCRSHLSNPPSATQVPQCVRRTLDLLQPRHARNTTPEIYLVYQLSAANADSVGVASLPPRAVSRRVCRDGMRLKHEEV